MSVERVVQSYRVLVGLEIHVQLATKSKMFTAAANGFGGEPNSQVDPVVLGLPGVLPVMNRRAVEYAIKVGLALGCTIARHTKWDRKSYYYPDLPKNYQISQYDLPLCHGGHFDLPDESGAVQSIRIRRAHLEEDAGKLLHEAPGGFAIDGSIVDLNRAGTPLLEIVTEPDFTTPRQVALFAQELQRIVQYLGVSEGQMQMGHMRFEPNINVHLTDGAGQVHKTAITEIKNLNSFAVLEKATAYEIARQLQQWQETGSLGKKSTYGWDEATQSTYWQRDKEEANDYRYFPDPDLMPVEVNDAWLGELKSQVGELPAARRKRYEEHLGLSVADASILAGDRETGDFFERVVGKGASPKRAANLLLSHGRRIANERGESLHSMGISAGTFADVAMMIDGNTLSPTAAGQVLDKINETVVRPGVATVGVTAAAPAVEVDVRAIAQESGLIQVSDSGAITTAVDAAIAENPKFVQDYVAGKDAALNALLGKVMKGAKGLNPKVVREQLEAKLKARRG